MPTESSLPPYTLLRSRRKTLALEIAPDGGVLARAPLRMPVAVIESFLREKAGWVEQARARALARAQVRQRAQAAPGGVLWLWGRGYPVRERPAGRTGPVWDGAAFWLSGQGGEREAAAFFTAEARRVLGERVALLAAQAGVRYASVAIGGARARWGSCGVRGELRFSWRLACVPPEAADYVVAHELAHIREMNHSAAFWREVARIWPGFEEGRQVLREFEREVDVSNL